MRTVSIVNLKGGVGKTVTSINLSYELMRRGSRVLLVDCDKQGNTSKFMRCHNYDRKSLSDVMLGTAGIKEVIASTEYESLDVLPANMTLLRADRSVLIDTTKPQQTRIRNALREIADDYTFCVITNALVASDDVIVPVTIDEFAFDGIREILAQIADVREYYNPGLNLAGYLVTQYKDNEFCNDGVAAMAKGFSIMDMMSDISREEVAEGAETIGKVSVFDIQPNEDNFYEISSIEQLKNSIFSMGGVQQNLLLARLPAGGKYKYKALAGHRRIYACIELVQEGHREFEQVPAVIKENIDKDTEDMLLIMTNSTQRELTDWEKVMQHMKLKEIIPKLKKRQGLDGKTRTLEADYLGVSEGQIAIYNTIGTRLDSWLMGMFKEGEIGISLAYEAAKLESERQKQLVQISVNKGSFSEEDIKILNGSSPVKGQMKIAEEQAESKESEKVTESVTREKVQNEPVLAEGKVTESDTFTRRPELKAEQVHDKYGEVPKKVTESDTFADVCQQEKELEKTHAKLKGGYSLKVIDEQIRKYEVCLNMLDNDKSRVPNVVAVYNCMLDALELLKINLLTQKEGDACEDI